MHASTSYAVVPCRSRGARRYILFHGKRHPAEMGAAEVTRFLSSLLFLYRNILELDLPWLDGIVRAKRPERLPVGLTREEVAAVLRPARAGTSTSPRTRSSSAGARATRTE